jgi:hypothetical protein
MTEKNRPTISRSTTTKVVDPTTGKSVSAEKHQQPTTFPPADRSFAQQNPSVAPKEVTPKAHASKTDEQDALKRASKSGKDLPKVDQESESSDDE